MKKILVTGGAGFVGRHICKHYLDQGDLVICVDNVVPLTGGTDPNANGWPLYDPKDYTNFVFLKRDCRDFFLENKDTDFDYVFHLAAMVGGREMIEFNPLAVAEDLAIDSLYWKWARETRPAKTICFSSSAVYPIKYQRRNNYVLLKEDMVSFKDDIGMPDMSYGWAKLTFEYLSKLAYERYGLKSVTYRPFSGYGEDQDMAYPFPSICKRVLEQKNQPVIKVWGTGDQMRDFIHIDDCIRGIATTIDRVDDASAINLSTGIFTSFKQFAFMAASTVGYKPEIVGMSEKPEGVFARGGDTQLQKKLGFISNIPLAEGIKRGLDFIAQFS